ncbi:ketopantoate reductase C-terminal domain-containing protein [Candidatus Dactylopiibacterium carminicum]
MLRAHWAKFMLNVGVNQTSAVLRAPFSTFHHDAHARAVTLTAMREVVALSQTAGIGLTQEDLDRAMRIIDALAPGAKTSMLQDIEAGRETEVDIFGGAVIALGQRYGVPTPVNQTLFDLIKVMEASNRTSTA